MISPELIEARKQYGRIKSRSKGAAKLERCLWCGKKISRFCDSHTIPRMVLENINSDGKFDYVNTIMQIPLEKTDQGMKEVTVFNLICNECDNTLFQEYENLENLKKLPTQRMLALIALKDLFYIMSKRLFEIELYKQPENRMSPAFIHRKQMVNYLDKRDFFLELDRIRNILDDESNSYELIFWDKVDYKVPVAYQGAVTVYGDMNGELVVDIYDDKASKSIKQMHLCIFPLDDCSVIFAFYNKDDTEYYQFANQLRAMDLETRLKFLGYFMFFISEDMILVKKIPHRTFFLEKTRSMFMDGYEFWTDSKEEAEFLQRKNLARFKAWKEDIFPGILTQKYAINA